MPSAETPVTRVSRPALETVESVGYGRSDLSYREFAEAGDSPRSTATRHLNQLTEESLVLRVRKGTYAVPGRNTFARILLDPSPYRRSLLLHADVLRRREGRAPAFLCLPIRGAYGMDLDRSIPVLPPDERLEERASPPYENVLWFDAPDDDVRDAGVPREADEDARDLLSLPETLPGLSPRVGLSLLASSLDPRHVRAALEAADRFDLEAEDVVEAASRLRPAEPPVEALHPNTVVFPAWLREFWQTATEQHSRGYLHEVLEAEA